MAIFIQLSETNKCYFLYIYISLLSHGTLRDNENQFAISSSEIIMTRIATTWHGKQHITLH